MRKVSDWSRYGYCPTCQAKRGHKCADLRFEIDEYVGPEHFMVSPHRDRIRIFKTKGSNEKGTSN